MAIYIPVDLRRRIRERDRCRCSYCLTTEMNSGIRMVFDHIWPLVRGGETSFENLCLACRSCNEYKSDLVMGRDAVTGETVPLFNPRLQIWQEHFEWNLAGTGIQGKTTIGRVTVQVLQMNHPAIAIARGRWVEVGWHPPTD